MFSRTKKKKKKHFCKYCFLCFSSKNILNKHKEVCLKINDKQTVKLKDDFMEFKNYCRQIPVPFKIHADFDWILEGVKSSKKTSDSYTEKYQNHIPCSFAYEFVCVVDKFNKPVFLYGGENAVNRFML